MDADILPPYNDRIFKTLLTHPDAKPALIDLISACIDRDVVDVQIRNNELPISDIEEKGERFDVNCITNDGTQIDVEMQGSRMAEGLGGHLNFINRSIYYLTDLHSSQKSRSIDYSELAASYQVTFCMYAVLPGRDGYINKANLRFNDGELLSEQINVVIIELSKLGDILKKSAAEMTSLEMWSVFLGCADNPNYREQINDIIERKEVFSMATEVLRGISKDDHERAKIRAQRKYETDMYNYLLAAKKKGLAEGMAEGMAEVKAKGLAEGKAEGMTEGIQLVAKKMLDMGMPIDDIVIATGLTNNEIALLAGSKA